MPMMNIINGGEHAENNIDLQEFMIIPKGAPTFKEALRYGVQTFHTLKKLLLKRGFQTGIGDEGGFAPNFKANEDVFEILIESIQDAGFIPGEDISIAIDAAASSFHKDELYNLSKSGYGAKNSSEMIQFYKSLVKN